jgi:hypothetical protein
MFDFIAIQNQLSTRYDLYGTIHRALRKAEMEALARLGALDAADDTAVAAMLADFRRLLVLARFHLVDENEHIHTALETVRPGSTAEFAHDHEEHERSFAEIEAMLAKIQAATAGARRNLVKALYFRYSRFIADDFAHMLEEETELQPVLQSVFTDEQLAAIEGRIIASIPPDVMLDFIRIMMPAIDPEVRQEMLGGMMRGMPAEAFHMVLDTAVKPVLAAADWQRLDNGLRNAT